MQNAALSITLHYSRGHSGMTHEHRRPPPWCRPHRSTAANTLAGSNSSRATPTAPEGLAIRLACLHHPLSMLSFRASSSQKEHLGKRTEQHRHSEAHSVYTTRGTRPVSLECRSQTPNRDHQRRRPAKLASQSQPGRTSGDRRLPDPEQRQIDSPTHKGRTTRDQPRPPAPGQHLSPRSQAHQPRHSGTADSDKPNWHG